MLEIRLEGSPLLCSGPPVPVGARGSAWGSVQQPRAQCRCQPGEGGLASCRVPTCGLQSMDRPRGLLPLGGHVGACPRIARGPLARPVFWLGGAGVHHHLAERCLNLAFFWGCT